MVCKRCICCRSSGLQELIMNKHGNLWSLIGVHSRVLAEVLDTAERWLVQEESQKSGKFLFYPIPPLSANNLTFLPWKISSPHSNLSLKSFIDISATSQYKVILSWGRQIKITYILLTQFVLLQRMKNYPCSGLSDLTDTRSREIHRERGQRHISNILQVRDTGKDSFTETHHWHVPLLWAWLEYGCNLSWHPCLNRFLMDFESFPLTLI